MGRISKRLHNAFSDTSLFRTAFIIDLFLCSVGYINIAAEVGKIFFFVWGLSLFTNRYLADFNIKKVNYYGWLVLFILSNIITVLIRGYSDGIWESVLMILNMPLIFFLFYGLHSEYSEEGGVNRLLKELYSLCNIFMVMSLILNVVSIISLYFIGKSITYSFGYLIVYENRFTGVYFNPNLMAFSSFCSAFCCHLLLKQDFVKTAANKEISTAKRTVTILSLVFNLIVILLTDSNATAIIIICYLISNTCYRFFGGKEIHFGYIFKRTISLIIVLAILTVTVFTVRYLCQTGATQTISTTDSTTNTFGDSDDELNRITFEHTNKNIDSGRIKLFRQGVNVIKHHPVFGVGKGNIIYYGNRYNNDKMKATLDWVMKHWNWQTTWGWDYGMIAMCAARLGDPETALKALFIDTQKNTYLPNGHNFQTPDRLRIYLPGNGALLTAVAMMCAGWDGCKEPLNPGFPKDGKWNVRWEGLQKMQ